MAHINSQSGQSYREQDLSVVREALRDKLEGNELVYVKPGTLASELDFTGQAVGKHLRTLRESDDEFEISLWGDSKTNPTWAVTRNKDSE